MLLLVRLGGLVSGRWSPIVVVVVVLRKQCAGDASAEPILVSNRFEVLTDLELEHSSVATVEAGPKAGSGEGEC